MINNRIASSASSHSNESRRQHADGSRFVYPSYSIYLSHSMRFVIHCVSSRTNTPTVTQTQWLRMVKRLSFPFFHGIFRIVRALCMFAALRCRSGALFRQAFAP